MIKFKCKCGRVYEVDEKYAGKAVRCKGCQTKVYIPQRNEEECGGDCLSDAGNTNEKKAVDATSIVLIGVGVLILVLIFIVNIYFHFKEKKMVDKYDVVSTVKKIEVNSEFLKGTLVFKEALADIAAKYNIALENETESIGKISNRVEIDKAVNKLDELLKNVRYYSETHNESISHVIQAKEQYVSAIDYWSCAISSSHNKEKFYEYRDASISCAQDEINEFNLFYDKSLLIKEYFCCTEDNKEKE